MGSRYLLKGGSGGAPSPMAPRSLHVHRGLAPLATCLIFGALLLGGGGLTTLRPFAPVAGAPAAPPGAAGGAVVSPPEAPRAVPSAAGPLPSATPRGADPARPLASEALRPFVSVTITVLTASAAPTSGSAPLLVNLTASAQGSSNATQFTFNWTFGDGQPNGITTVAATSGLSGVVTVPHVYGLVTPGTPVVYTATVNVSDNAGDRNATSHKVFVTVTPVLTLSASATPGVVTFGHEVSLVPVAGGGLPPYKFVWSGTPAGCNPGTVDLNCTTTGTGPYTVRVSVTDAASNHNSTSVAFTVNPSILLLAGYQGFYACSGTVGTLQENFSANVTGGTPPYAYSWSFGDGSAAASGSRAMHVYTASGNFTARVSVNDSGGSTANYSLKVTSTFSACGVAAPPSFGAPLVVVEAAVALAFVIVLVLALAVFLQRRRAASPTPARAWNRELDPPHEPASGPTARPAPKPSDAPPPEEGTIQ